MTLKAHAHCEGPIKQVALICKALSTYAPVAEPIDTTARKICELVDRTFAIGIIDKDLLKCIALLNCINDKSFKSIQIQVSCGLANLTTEAPYTSSQIRKLFQTISLLSLDLCQQSCTCCPWLKRQPQLQTWFLMLQYVSSLDIPARAIQRSGVSNWGEEWLER